MSVYALALIEIGLSALYDFSVRPDFNIIQQSHGLFAIAKLLVFFVVENPAAGAEGSTLPPLTSAAA